jgi:hypothetical protein
MKQEFVPYDRALKLNQLGFNEPCFGYYVELVNPTQGILTIEKCDKHIDGCLAPTFQQVFRWFRENYNLHYEIRYRPSIRKNLRYLTKYIDLSPKYLYQVESSLIEVVGTYKEAELACLDKLIEILETKQQGQ